MDNEDIVLETRFVGDIKGHFLVPEYQRGYRWEKSEVGRLLEDVYEANGANYCLQPIVVKKNGDIYELIDGQQRLTTIYFIYRYLQTEMPKLKLNFTLSYETREQSEEFLCSLDDSKQEDNIDFWFMAQAYKTIREWFEDKEKNHNLPQDILAFKIAEWFKEKVKVIWYEVGQSEDAIGLFTRLNIGKIPLTSSELVKSIFLSKNAKLKSAEFEKNTDVLDSKAKETIIKEKQEEIALQWDNIEKELHNDSLWFFLTNNKTEQYQTRIDLILDLIAEKPANNREKYFTFFYFDNKNQESLEDVWREIQQTFLMLKGWYENHTMYHKVGYLIASGSDNTLQEIYNAAKNKTKREFDEALDELIKKSVESECNYSELSYEKHADKMKKLLLLFNVESVRRIDGQSARFPFDKYKFDADGKVVWSLEHIHAQHSEGMKTQESWKKWLELHIPSIKAVRKDSTDLISRMETAINNNKLDRWEFEELQQKAVVLLPNKGNFGENGKVVWSSEHINAQHSEGMKTQESWKKWLELHIPSIKAVRKDSTDLISRMETAINNKKLEGREFEALQQDAVALLSKKGHTEYLHSIANMALLNTRDNSALNNSVFDVKRNQIIKMDKEGRYIPFCTKMVFLKYYTKSDEQSVWFWGHQDRKAYIEAINEVLATNPKYIEPIILEKEEN